MAMKIYNGGFYGLLRRFEAKQRLMLSPLDYLPPIDSDLEALKSRLVTETTGLPQALAQKDRTYAYLQIHAELLGQSELLYVHAMLISISRRRPLPPEIAPFFIRLWTEQGDWLAQNLTTRWKISAATTFGDIGTTHTQRALGMGLSVLFDMIKLYESERSVKGRSGTQLGRRVPQGQRPAIGLGLKPYAIAKGDLDRNLLARLFSLSEQDAVIRPLALSMLEQVIEDNGTVFARMQRRKGVEPMEDGIAAP